MCWFNKWELAVEQDVKHKNKFSTPIFFHKYKLLERNKNII
jgi:hypothetical protein